MPRVASRVPRSAASPVMSRAIMAWRGRQSVVPWGIIGRRCRQSRRRHKLRRSSRRSHGPPRLRNPGSAGLLGQSGNSQTRKAREVAIRGEKFVDAALTRRVPWDGRAHPGPRYPRPAACGVSRKYGNITEVEKKPPPAFDRGGFSIQIKSLAVTYFRIDKANTSIGAERFHFRVRKGIGWFPLAMAARQTVCNGRVMARPPRIRTICFDVCRKSSQYPTTICHVRDKSLGCYMVKPHGQLVLVS
jgi:hypothetical protein